MLSVNKLLLIKCSSKHKHLLSLILLKRVAHFSNVCVKHLLTLVITLKHDRTIKITLLYHNISNKKVLKLFTSGKNKKGLL